MAVFIENRGQFDKAVKFQLKTPTGTLWVTEKGLVFEIAGGSKAEFAQLSHPNGNETSAVERFVFAADFVDADLSNFEPSEPLPGVYNFLTSDPAKSKTGVRGYREIVAHRIWPGIDLRLFLNGRGIEQEFILQAGADPERIRVSYRGADHLQISADGSLVVTTPAGQLSESKPHVYQDIGGRRIPVATRFTLEGSDAYAFELSEYDTEHPLVIDPTLLFSTYLGGNGGDQGNGVAVDLNGNIYVTGQTTSSNFPITVGQTAATVSAAFITKLNSSGTALVYSTYIQSPTPWWDGYRGRAIAVDISGNAYIAGFAGVQVNPYPTTPTAFQQCGRNVSVFVTKLNPTGSLLYSSCIGGEIGQILLYLGERLALAADDNGRAYVVGTQFCGLSTTTNAFQRTCVEGSNNEINPFIAVFDTKAAGQASLVYSSYLAGNGNGVATGVALDKFGNIYVAGFSRSTDFPVTPDAYQTTFPATFCISYNQTVPCFAGFIAKLNPSLVGTASLVYSTRLASAAPLREDFINAIAVDDTGAAYVTGMTTSSSFPTTLGAFQTTNRSGQSGTFGTAFVTKLTPSGSAIVYSTYLGGATLEIASRDSGQAIAVDSSKNAYITGYTSSTTFPVKDSVQTGRGGGTCNSTPYFAPCLDAFVTELNPQASALVYSTYLGGNQEEQGFGIALDSYGNATVTGVTRSTDFPTRIPFQPALGGSSNAFVVQLGPGVPTVGPTILRVWPPQAGNAGSATIAFIGSGFVAGATVSLSCPGQASVPGSTVIVSADGTYKTATFRLIGLPVQICSIVVRRPDGLSTTLSQGFAVQQGGAPQVWVDIVGRNLIRIGSDQTYFVVYGNRGNIDSGSDFVTVWLSFPKTIGWKVSPGTNLSVATAEGGNVILSFSLLSIPPGNVRALPVTLRVPPSVSSTFQMQTWTNQP